MLNIDEMKKIGLDACVDMIGEDLVYAHKDLCCPFWSKEPDENNLFSYGLGMDTKEPDPYPKDCILINETPMEYYAYVFINSETGEVTRDYKNSTLPE